MHTLSRFMLIGWVALLPIMGLAFSATSAHAQAGGGGGGGTGTIDLTGDLDTVGGGAGLNNSDLPTVIGFLINVFLGFLGIVFLVLVLYAGFIWMTAGGNESKVETAKKLLVQAIIGLIIIMTAYAISRFVVDAIQSAVI